MSFLHPEAAWLLLAVPLFVLVIRLSLKRKTLQASSFHIIAELVDSLPLLSRSYLLRRRLQLIFLFAAVVALSVAGLMPVMGDTGEPVRALLFIDNHSLSVNTDGRDMGLAAVREKSLALLGGLNSRDAAAVFTSGEGPVTEGFVTRRKARKAVRDISASDLAPGPDDASFYLASLEGLAADMRYLVTSRRAFWSAAAAGRERAWDLLAASSPSDEKNIAIIDVELQPELLTPGRYDVFCRVAAYPDGAAAEGLLEFYVNGERLFSKPVSFEPGVSSPVVFEDLDIPEGLLEIRALPEDTYMKDNVFRAPIRTGAVTTVDLVSAGNEALEAALHSLGTMKVTVLSPADPPGKSALTVFDGETPEDFEGSALYVHPFSMPAGIDRRGEALHPRSIEAAGYHRLLDGVSFENLEISRLPILTPPPGIDVLARADGYPIVLAGRDASGRRVAVIAFDPVADGWIYDSSFPILTANLLTWVSRDSRTSASSFSVGDTLRSSVLGDGGTLVSPSGEKTVLGSIDYTFPVSGSYRYRGPAGSGTVSVNLLDEKISAAVPALLTSSTAATGAYPDRPFSAPLQGILIVLGILLLVLEAVIAPAPTVGRFP